MERGRRRKWQEVLFRPPQRKGRAPSRTHRETQGTSTGSSTQKTVASAGFFPTSERISVVVSKLSTGEEFQRHGDESSTSFPTHEQVIFYTTELFLYFRTLTIAKKKNVYLLLTFERYYEIKQKLFNNLCYLITRFFKNHLKIKKIKKKACNFFNITNEGTFPLYLENIFALLEIIVLYKIKYLFVIKFLQYIN